MRKVIAGVAVAVTVSLGTTPVSAAIVTFSGSTATWSDVVKQNSSTPVSYSGNGSATALVSWGVPAAYPYTAKSSWKFATVATSPISVSAAADSGLFTVANFAHTNRPINNSITGAKLTFSTDVNVDGTDLGFKTFIFDFTLDETPNQTNPCAYGGANHRGVNINGCADKVTFNQNASSDTFTAGASTYTLNLFGFVLPGTTTAVSDFLTRENAVNNAQIVGQLDVSTDPFPPPPPPDPVPEPQAWGLMLLGLGVAGGALRRRRFVDAPART